MSLEKLLLPSISFFTNKINDTLDTGLSRIELSVYCYSFDEFLSKICKTEFYNQKVTNALKSLNEMDIYYRVSLKEMVTSYFKFFKKQMVVLDDKIQIIVYSYNKRSSTFVGMINKKSRNSATD